jgi:hypothetical protein
MSRDEILAALVRANAIAVRRRCPRPKSSASPPASRATNPIRSRSPSRKTIGRRISRHSRRGRRPPPSIVDPGPLPAELLRVPGFVSEVMDYCLETAPYPNQALAFCGALALQAFLAGRKVRDQADNRTNIYLLGLAFSAVGKDQPRKINAKVAHHVGLSPVSAITSLRAKGFRTRCSARRACCFRPTRSTACCRRSTKPRTPATKT